MLPWPGRSKVAKSLEMLYKTWDSKTALFTLNFCQSQKQNILKCATMDTFKFKQTLSIKQAFIMDMIVNSSLWGCVEILKAVENFNRKNANFRPNCNDGDVKGIVTTLSVSVSLSSWPALREQPQHFSVIWRKLDPGSQCSSEKKSTATLEMYLIDHRAGHRGENTYPLDFSEYMKLPRVNVLRKRECWFWSRCSDDDDAGIIITVQRV